MKRYTLPLITLSVVYAGFLAHAQGTFQNLDFEATTVSGPPQESVPLGTALPGWSAFGYTPSYGTTVLTTVWFNSISLGGPGVSLMDTNVGSGLTPIQGRYSVLLFGGGATLLYSAGISQIGLVPTNARTLLMDVISVPSNPPFIVTLGGETLNMVAQQTFPGYTLYGGDITTLAGQVATLTVSQPPRVGVQPSGIELDNIQFSSVPTPEPNALGLLCLGALLSGRRLFRRRR
jgi:hypothetical protein